MVFEAYVAEIETQFIIGTDTLEQGHVNVDIDRWTLLLNGIALNFHLRSNNEIGASTIGPKTDEEKAKDILEQYSDVFSFKGESIGLCTKVPPATIPTGDPPPP